MTPARSSAPQCRYSSSSWPRCEDARAPAAVSVNFAFGVRTSIASAEVLTCTADTATGGGADDGDASLLRQATSASAMTAAMQKLIERNASPFQFFAGWEGSSAGLRRRLIMSVDTPGTKRVYPNERKRNNRKIIGAWDNVLFSPENACRTCRATSVPGQAAVTGIRPSESGDNHEFQGSTGWNLRSEKELRQRILVNRDEIILNLLGGW